MKILCRYQYDPLDRLMGVGLLEGDSRERFYQKGHLTTELGQQTQRTIFRHQTQPLVQIQNEAGMTETTLLATDQAHSLLKTLSRNNPQQFAYSTYGHHPAESGLSALIGFNGECPDATTGHYLLGQGKRAFNPVLMRFNSPDELSPFNEIAGFNSYVYCGADPVNFTDPSGNIKVATSIAHNMAPRSSTALITIRSTATTIKPTGLEERYPILTTLLKQTTKKPVRSTPSAPPPPAELINLPKNIPSGWEISNQGATLLPQHVNLNNFGASYDYIKSTPGFQTVGTWKQVQEFVKNKTRYHSRMNQAEKIANRDRGIELAMEIKKTSVENHYIQSALKEIRR